MDDYPRGFEPAEPHFSILNYAKWHVETQAAKWTADDDDVAPCVILRNHTGGITAVALVANMNSGDEKDHLAAVITATLAVEGATEAAYISSAWWVSAKADEVAEVLPSEHPDRTEAAMIMYASPDGDSLHKAEIVDRTPGGKPPALGPWEDIAGMQMGGRFSDAIHAGLKIARLMPQEMREFIEEAQANGEGQAVLNAFLGAMQKSGRL